MNRGPYPFEVTLESGVTLRGLEYPQDGPPVVLVHGFGGDADSWGGIPVDLRTAGFRTINLELRGHGLSEGEPDRNTTKTDLTEAITLISGSFGPVGMVALEESATVCLVLGKADGAPVHILVSPLPNPTVTPGESVPAMRAIFAGTGDDEADGFLRSTYQGLAGQNMWFSSGTSERGADLLRSKPHMVEQTTTFLRRYLTGFHLAWAAEQTSDADR